MEAVYPTGVWSKRISFFFFLFPARWQRDLRALEGLDRGVWKSYEDSTRGRGNYRQTIFCPRGFGRGGSAGARVFRALFHRPYGACMLSRFRFPTLKRGANNRCAYGARARFPTLKRFQLPTSLLSREFCRRFGRPSGAGPVAGTRTQGSRPLARTPPWAIVGRSSGAGAVAGARPQGVFRGLKAPAPSA